MAEAARAYAVEPELGSDHGLATARYQSVIGKSVDVFSQARPSLERPDLRGF